MSIIRSSSIHLVLAVKSLGRRMGTISLPSSRYLLKFGQRWMVYASTSISVSNLLSDSELEKSRNTIRRPRLVQSVAWMPTQEGKDPCECSQQKQYKRSIYHRESAFMSVETGAVCTIVSLQIVLSRLPFNT